MGIRQNALQRLSRKSISAKEIASQAWCEKQMELYILTPMPQTAAMERGAAFHETQKVEVFVPLSVEPTTWPDRFYKTAYENYTSLISLKEKGFCRELKLYGSINGYRLTGQLDELRIRDGKAVVVEDKTIGSAGTDIGAKVKADTIQVSLYRKLLDDIRSGRYTFDHFANSYSLETMNMSNQFLGGLDSIGVRKELQSMRAIWRKVFEELASIPELSNVLDIRYFERSSRQVISEMNINYDAGALNDWLQYAMKYWNGEREAQPVPESEKWKCKICRFFGRECTVWYDK